MSEVIEKRGFKKLGSWRQAGGSRDVFKGELVQRELRAMKGDFGKYPGERACK
jgi:hypothetical protein